mgnify:CR=1 FL=1
MSMTLQDISTSMAQECAACPHVIAGYVFGSWAKGTARENSDVDVAILIAYGTEHAFDYLEFKVQLERRLNRDVDLVLLNQAGEIIKYLIRRDGVRVFERDPRKRKDWEIRSRKMYQDYLHLHQIYMQGMRRRFGVQDGEYRDL